MSATPAAKDFGSSLIEPIKADAAVIGILRRTYTPTLKLPLKNSVPPIDRHKVDRVGYPGAPGSGKTGVVGIVKGGSGDRAVGLSADIDALPMTEHNTFAHASIHPGKMHACVTMATPPCCWPRPSTYPFIAISTAPST